MERDSLRTMLVPFVAVFSQPSFHNFVVVLEGWIVAGMRAMTSTALAARGMFPKHFATYYRFFSEGAWSPDALGTALLEWVLPFAPPGPLVIVVDDTLARKTGKNIWGANLHHDPLGWLPNAVAFGHNWVVLAIVIRVPLVQRHVAVPVLWRLYRSKKSARGRRPEASANEKRRGPPPPRTIAPVPSWPSNCSTYCERPLGMGASCTSWATAPMEASPSRAICPSVPSVSAACP